MPARHPIESRIRPSPRPSALRRSVAVLALAFAAVSAAQAATSASLSGFGLNLSQPYGLSESWSSSLIQARVTTRPFPGEELLWIRPGFGQPGPWGSASVPYPIEFRGEALADPVGGQLKAHVDARFAPELGANPTVPFRFAQAKASATGKIKLQSSGNPRQSVGADLFVDYDGSFSALGSYQLTVSVTSLSTPGASWSALASGPAELLAGSVDSRIGVHFSGNAGETFQVAASIVVTATTLNTSLGSYHSADFYRTATLSFVSEPGTSVVGVDGFLASTAGVSPIPEPAAASLMLAGGLALWLQRRRRCA